MYDGDAALWIEAANTLKARLLLRQVETATDRSGVYAQVDAAAALGISDASHDFTIYSTSTAREQNQWYQFMIEQRAGYIAAGSFLVNLLQSTNDPRLGQYFSTNEAGEYVGTVSGGTVADVSSLSAERIDPAAPLRVGDQEPERQDEEGARGDQDRIAPNEGEHPVTGW